MRRRTVLGAVGVAGAGGVVVAALGLGGARDPQPQSRTGPRTTATVVRTTLAQEVKVLGELSYGPALPLDSVATGTVTWLPEVGTVIKRGDPVLRADEVPVVLLFGAVPMYRQLGLDAKGIDVRQLEDNLRALGYYGFADDDTLTGATVSVIKRWQRRLKLPETGELERERVIFAGGPIRVASHTVRLGASATGEVLKYTGVSKVVTVQADAGGAAWAAAGAAVTVVLPGAVSVAGTVASVGNEASAEADGPATVQVVVELADQAPAERFEKTPVDVRYLAQERKDVLAVPVSALLALAEGGYGLEVVSGGTTRIVAVTPGFVAGGLIEVSGAGIDAGMVVGVAE